MTTPPAETTAGRALDALRGPVAALVVAWVAAVVLVVHSDPLSATLVGLGAIGALLSGLTGVGGAIIMIPLLYYVPRALGVGQLAMHDVAAISMVQVFAAGVSGVAGHMRGGHVDRRTVMVLGGGMMAGAFLGALVSRWLPAEALKAVFASMAAAGAAVLLMRPPADAPVAPHWNATLGFTLSFGVGALAGAVGAGGAFLLIPLMLNVLRIPPRITVGSSLAVVALGATTGLAGKLITGQVPLWPSLALVTGALPAAQLGATLSRRLSTRALRLVLAIVIAVVAVRMWVDVLS